jgi:hypothetical protein
MNKCQPLALGIAIGVVWALYVFFAGIFATFGWGVALVETLGSFYIGYGASVIVMTTVYCVFSTWASRQEGRVGRNRAGVVLRSRFRVRRHACKSTYKPGSAT